MLKKLLPAEMNKDLALSFLKWNYFTFYISSTNEYDDVIEYKVFNFPFSFKKHFVKLPRKEIAGIYPNNPIGIPAGFDKNGIAIESLANLGFGFIEIGSVTPNIQYGNLKPRVHYLHEEKSLINFMGLPNKGIVKVSKNVKRTLSDNDDSSWFPPVGLSLAVDFNSYKFDEYFALMRHINNSRIKFLTLNISCPNIRYHFTPRDVEEKLGSFIEELRYNLHPSIVLWIKLAPDYITPAHYKTFVEIAKKNKVKGLVLANTSTDKYLIRHSRHSNKDGGISGNLLKEKSFKLLKDIKPMTEDEIDIISVGGIDCIEDIEMRLEAGASLFQLYTAMVYKGLNFPYKLVKQYEQINHR